MGNIIITSEMRVGSRWVHYLLRDLLNKKVSGEIDVKELPHSKSIVKHRFNENRIVKFHHATKEDIFEHIKGAYKVIGIVRNPRDRITSWTFHQRYKPVDRGLKEIKAAASDKEAVKVTFNLKQAQDDNERQLRMMTRGCSTKTKGFYHGKYIWTCYHWLIEDTFREIKKILEFLDYSIRDERIHQVIENNSFESKSGRKRGEEKRDDDWRRKGIEYDCFRWFDEEMIIKSQAITKAYWDILIHEEGL